VERCSSNKAWNEDRQELCYTEEHSVHQHVASSLCLVKEGETHVLQTTKRANHYKVAAQPMICSDASQNLVSH